MANNYNPNNYNAYGNYNPYNSMNYYSQKMQNLQGIREQIEKQMQDIQNMQQMQQQFMNQQSQPQIQQTFQLSNPTNFNNDFDTKYAENIEEVKKNLVYRNSLFVNKDMNKLWFKDPNGNIRLFEINEIIEKDEKAKEDEKNMQRDAEIDELKKQVEQLAVFMTQQNNIEPNEPIPVEQNNNVIGKIEPVKKSSRKK